MNLFFRGVSVLIALGALMFAVLGTAVLLLESHGFTFGNAVICLVCWTTFYFLGPRAMPPKARGQFMQMLLRGVFFPAVVVAALMTFAVVFIAKERSFGLFVGAVLAWTVAYLGYRTFTESAKKAASFVRTINARDGHTFDDSQILGLLEKNYIAFDARARTFALCNADHETYQVFPFEHVIRWDAEFTEQAPRLIGNQIQMGRRGKFVIVLLVRDTANPRWKFYVGPEADAQQWLARLEVLMNG